MGNTTIKVNPSGLPNAVKVATDTVDGTYYPEYKISYSESGTTPVHVSTTNPLPVLIDATTPLDVENTPNVISVVNSRAAATLAASGVFQGTVEDVTKYGRVGVSIYSDNATDGTLTFEVSRDGVNWGGPERTWSDTRFAQPHMWTIVEKYFRIKYTNGSVEATNLTIQTQYSNNSSTFLGHQLNETLKDETEAIATRSVLVGKTHGDIYKNVYVSGEGKLQVDIPLTAFGDLRTAELSPVFQTSFEYTVTNTEIGTIEIAGSGAVTQADAMCIVNTGSTTGSVAEWESAHNAKYRAGLGGLMRIAGLFTTGVTGTEQMLGMADADGSSATHKNGYAVGYSGSVFSFMRWQNDVLFTVAQSAWDDPMDGTGPSGMTLDPTKLNVYEIRFQYLGAGAIQLGIESAITGQFVVAHTELYANLNVVPSQYNPNFHLMAHAVNLATTEDLTIKCSSMAYFIEGKTKYTEVHQPQFSSGTREKTTVTSEVAIFTIRNKLLYASKTNYLDLILEIVTAAIETNSANSLGNIRVVKNATLGGTPSYADINTTNSVVEIDVAGTTVTGGTELLSIPLAGKNDKDIIDLTNFEFILSAGETITVSGTSANSATIDASVLWKELF